MSQLHRLALLGLLLCPVPGSGMRSQGLAKLDPLPEMQDIEDYEVVASDRLVTLIKVKGEKDERGQPRNQPVGYSEHKLLKGKLNGKSVYLHKAWGERSRPDLGCFELFRSIGLYDAKMQLIALRQLDQTDGKPRIQEFRWSDGKLMHSIGKKRPKPLEAPARPQYLLGVMLVGKMKDGEKRTIHVLQGREVQDAELRRDRKVRMSDGIAVQYLCTGAMAGKWIVAANGKGLKQAQLDDPAKIFAQAKLPRADYGLQMDPKHICTSHSTDAARKASRGRHRKWANRVVGLRLRLPPKNWKMTGKLQGNLILDAATPDKYASFKVFVWYTSYTAGPSGIIKRRIWTDEKKAAKKGTFSKKDVEIAKRTAVRIDFDQSSRGNTRRESRVFFEGKGCALELQFGVWKDGPKDYSHDFKSILKSVRFDK